MEVRVLWGDSQVYARTYRRPRAVHVGDVPSCDFRIPESMLGVIRWPLVQVTRNGTPVVSIPPHARFLVDTREKETSEGHPYHRPATVPVERPNAQVPLVSGTCIMVLTGPLTLIVSAFERRHALPRPRIPVQALRCHGLSVAAHVLVLALLVLVHDGASPSAEETAQVPYRFFRVTYANPLNPRDDTALLTHEPRPRRLGRPLHEDPGFGWFQIGKPVEWYGIWGGDPLNKPSAQRAPLQARAPAAARLPADPVWFPTSTFAILPTGASSALAHLRQGETPSEEDVGVEDLLYELAPVPPNLIGGPHLRFLVDAMPSPFEDRYDFVRIVLHAPNVLAKPRRRLFLVEATGETRDVSAVVERLVRPLATGSEVAMMSVGRSVHVESPWSVDRSEPRIRQVLERMASRPRGAPAAFEEAFDHALDLACRAGSATDLVLVHRTSVGPAKQALQKRLSDASCGGVSLSSMSLGPVWDEDMYRLTKGRSWNVEDPQNHPELSRAGDPLGEPAAVDVVVTVTFDPKRVRYYRLLGYENARDPVPVWSLDEGTPRISTIRPGELISAVYEVDQEERGGVQVQVDYRDAVDLVPRRVALGLSPERTYETVASAPCDLRHAIGVAAFAERLRWSPYASRWSLDTVRRLASARTPREAELARLIAFAQRQGEAR
jgi:hypothetical protein